MTASLVHVQRECPPWRAPDLTECGEPLAGLPVLTRGGFLAKVAAQGSWARASTCHVCWSAVRRWPAWDTDPAQVINRDTFMGRAHPALRCELRALAALVSRRRAEFDLLLAQAEVAA